MSRESAGFMHNLKYDVGKLFNLTLFDFVPCCDSKNPLRYELNISPKCKQKSEPLP